jgi:hypothetical protein
MKKKITLKEMDLILKPFEANSDVKGILIKTPRDREVCEFLRKKEKVIRFEIDIETQIDCTLTPKGISIKRRGGYRSIKRKELVNTISKWIVFVITIATFVLVLLRFIKDY